MTGAGRVGRPVVETLEEGALPMFVHPDWVARFPWVFQGTTTRGPSSEPLDLRMFGPAPAAGVMERWERLRRETGFLRVVHGRQVHGPHVMVHQAGPPGLVVGWGWDGHATRARGVLLAVSLADCVPVFLVDPVRGVVALLHAGWRGTAGGVLEAGLSVLGDRFGSRSEDLVLHLGPSICGECYEVSPAVFDALGCPLPDGPEPVDLRAILARRAASAGIRPEEITVSEACTRCGDWPFFSYRAGDEQRHLGLIGIRPSTGSPGIRP